MKQVVDPHVFDRAKFPPAIPKWKAWLLKVLPVGKKFYSSDSGITYFFKTFRGVVYVLDVKDRRQEATDER